MFTFEELYKTHLRCRKGHRKKSEVIKFENRLVENLLRIEKSLKNIDKYSIKYYSFVVMEPKKRVIYATPYEFRIVNASICESVLKPTLEKIFLNQNMACRENKGTHKAQKLLTQHLSEQYWSLKHNNFYCLKCDIKSYFESINHEILKKFLCRIINEPRALQLLFKIIDSYGKDEGIPLGNQSSQFFALLYLHPLDVMLESKGLKWVRYMDDFCIVHESKELLFEVYDEIVKYCSSLELELNQKTQIIKVSKGFDFLSFRYHVSGSGKVVRNVKRKSRKRIRKKVRQMQKNYSLNMLDGDSIGRTYASYHGHLIHGHTYHFRNHALNITYQRELISFENMILIRVKTLILMV